MSLKKFWDNILPPKIPKPAMMTVKAECGLVLNDDVSVRNARMVFAMQAYGTDRVIAALEEMYKENANKLEARQEKDLPDKIFWAFDIINTPESLAAMAELQCKWDDSLKVARILIQSTNTFAVVAFSKMMNRGPIGWQESEVDQIIDMLDHSDEPHASRMIAYLAEKFEVHRGSLLKGTGIVLDIAHDARHNSPKKTISAGLNEDIITMLGLLGKPKTINITACSGTDTQNMQAVLDRALSMEYLSKEARGIAQQNKEALLQASREKEAIALSWLKQGPNF